MRTRLQQIRSWLRALVSRGRLDADIADELRFHLDARTQDLMRRGLTEPEARRRARLEFGAMDRFRDECREARGVRVMDEAGADIRYALRQMRRTPTLTAVILLIVALGVGGNTAIFGLLDSVLLKTLPVESPDQLRQVTWLAERTRTGFRRTYDGTMLPHPSGKAQHFSVSYAAYLRLRDESTGLRDVIAFKPANQVNVQVPGQESAAGSAAESIQRSTGHAELADTQLVSGNYFDALRVRPALGRVLASADESRGAAPVVVLSHGFWQRMFAADTAVLGRTLTINGAAFAIVGVAPRGFHGVRPGTEPDLFVAITMQPTIEAGPSILDDGRYWWVEMMGRLPPGTAEERARAELEMLLRQEVLSLAVPGDHDMPRVLLADASRGLDALRRTFARPLHILMTAAGLILLIVCANLSGLLLARGLTRQQEMASRLALGASRGRLVRQLLTESVVTATIGGAIGTAAALLLRNLLPALLAPGDAGLRLDMTPDVRVLLFSLACCLFTGIASGLPTALRLTRGDLSPLLTRSVTRPPAGSAGGPPRLRAGKALVAIQVALCLVLLVGAGLFVRTLVHLRAEALGFNPEQLLVFQIDPTLNGYKDVRLHDFYEQLARQIDTLPGVRSVSLSRWGLLTGSSSGDTFRIPQDGSAPQNGSTQTREADARTHAIGPRYFETMEIRRLAGRDFTWQDREGQPRVVAINETFAKTFFPGRNPIGSFLLEGDPATADRLEIVAVIADAKYDEPRHVVPPTVYTAYRQTPQRGMTFAVRAEGEPTQLVSALRATVAALDRQVPPFEIRTQVQQNRRALARERMFVNLVSAFAGLALVLASLGIYGTLAYASVRRTREIGLRVALGATRGHVRRLIWGETVIPLIVGLTAGGAAALAAARLLDSQLFGVTASDPLTLIAAAAVLGVCGSVAAWIPSRRASRIDPIVALRAE